MEDLLNLVAREGASELLLRPEGPPVMLLQGKQRVIDGMLLTTDNVAELFRGIATPEQRQELDRCGAVHFTFSTPNLARFNVRAVMQGESVVLSITSLER